MAILWPFIWLAAIGLVLSLVSHGCALFGLPQPEEAWVLHVGVFVVLIPAIFVSSKLTGEFKLKDHWKAAMRGCPRWMQIMTFIFGVYAIINFILFIPQALNVGQQAAGAPTPPEIIRGFSGHWMAFYSAAMAILYSAWATSKHDSARRCPNAHPVSPAAVYCETCGAQIDGRDRAVETT
ncbi:MAG TPA: hypothetical protein VKE98_13850 [Gemmataceae bacterium]|nr:hypothetical protein [Gemmataceae bacterium]